LKRTHHQIAIFVDYENVKISEKGSFCHPDSILKAIYDEIQNIGQIRLVKVYLAMGLEDNPKPLNPGQIFNLYKSGADPIPVPSFKTYEGQKPKNIADSVMICDIMEALCLHPQIDIFCLATGDKDFIPIVRRLRNYGKEIILFHRGNYSRHLIDEISLIQCSTDVPSKCINLDTLLGTNTFDSKAKGGEKNGK